MTARVVGKLKPMETYSNWCHIDRLDGEDLKHGERVQIRFPDGTTEEVDLVVHHDSYTVSEMGRPTQVPVSKAGILLSHHGMEVWVRIPPGTLMRRVESDG